MAASALVVANFLEAFRRGDVDAVLDWLNPGVYFVTAGHDVAPVCGDFSGHAGFCAWWAEVASSGLQLEPLDIRELDDAHVYAKLMASGIAGGSWSSITRAFVYTVHAGRIEAIEVFADASRAYRRARRPLERLP